MLAFYIVAAEQPGREAGGPCRNDSKRYPERIHGAQYVHLSAGGDNRQKAQMVRVEYERILHYLREATEGWQTRAHMCSSLTGEGIEALWHVIEIYRAISGKSGVMQNRRKKQTLD